jgi:hypothetical protein
MAFVNKPIMKTPARLALILLSTLTVICSDIQAQTTPTSSKRAGPPSDISAAVGINEIKLEMAESRFKLSKSTKSINDLVNALEGYLNGNCMGTLLQTLAYAGNPTEPTCISRMEKILEINPNNPVGICVRDGISAKTCIEAYQNQKVAPVFSGSTSEEIDPALKVGISAATNERIEKVEQTLREVNQKYQDATDLEEKRKLISDAATLYDQALSMACKLSGISLTAPESSDAVKESTEISQARDRLLQIPPGIRRDYQTEMEKKALEELNNSSTSEDRKREIKELLKVIHDPSGVSASQLANLERTRLILERCARLIDVATQIVPELPATTCYREGWQTPKCIASLKKWRLIKLQERAIAKGTPPSKAGTPSIISTF